ncbi:MAG: tryptophan halogenase family protein [Steroidobacteraceae bacterium]
MERHGDRVIIVGGGSAGWITAGLVAAELRASGRGTEVVLVESPDIPIIGVGEGSWPSMRMTLQRIGLAESQLLVNCEATFKQGTRFINWTDSAVPSSYLHPFSLPSEYASLNLAEHWLAGAGGGSFAEFVTPQAAVIEAGLAPKQPATPEYAFNVNYGYHFDAGKFAQLLHDHAVAKLGVRYVSANLVDVDLAGNGDIQAIRLDNGERLEGSLFVDCTGQRALLIGRYPEAQFVSVRHVLLNDTALALQLPYQDATQPLPSTTNATAVPTGWIWDIGLQTRRGIGHVYSSSHASEADAEAALRQYVRQVAPQADLERLSPRRIQFDPGYRSQFWVGNCVAVGLSGGFIEPLEASALALIEQAASFISGQLPANRETMTVVARRFNDKMTYHWSRIIEFLKLHYVLSGRTEGYWLASRDPASCPDALKDKLLLWQQQAPWHDDAPRVDELFPSASYQYVLYGMGFRPRLRSARGTTLSRDRDRAVQAVREAAVRAQQMRKLLPTNRQLIHSLAPLQGAA